MRRLIPTTAVIVVLLILGILALEQRDTAVATLVVSVGEATVQQSRTQFGVWQRETAVSLSAGDALTVYQGDRIVVPQQAAARLNLQDGSVVELTAGTTLALSELVITEGDYRVQLQLLAGKTVNRVTRLLGADDYFKVSTPSSTASVRGTVFTVELLSEIATFVAVDEGTVQVEMAGQLVMVQAGEMVTAVIGQPLQVQPQSNPSPTSQPIPSAVPSLTSTPIAPKVMSGTAVLPTATRLTINPTIHSTTATLPPRVLTIVNTPPILGTLLPTAVLPTSTPWLPTATITPEATATATVIIPSPTAESTATAAPAPTNTPLPPPSATATMTPLPEPTATPELVTLCHIPPGNPDNRHTIQVPPSDVQGHLNHGDYLGPCT